MAEKPPDLSSIAGSKEEKKSMSDTPGGSDWGLMERDAFNEEVYAGLLGFSEEKMQSLRDEGII